MGVDGIDLVRKIENVNATQKGKNENRYDTRGLDGFGEDVVPVRRGCAGFFEQPCTDELFGCI